MSNPFFWPRNHEIKSVQVEFDLEGVNGGTPRRNEVVSPLQFVFEGNSWYRNGCYLHCHLLHKVTLIDQYFVHAGSSVQRKKKTNPRLAADPATSSAIFVSDFEDNFGTNHPRFQTSFKEGTRRAKSDCKFFLVYLHDKTDAESQNFCRNVLCTPLITDFINENFVFWGGDISMKEGNNLYRMLRVSQLPFFAIISSVSGNQNTLLDRIEGKHRSEY